MTGPLPKSNPREGKRILVVDDEPRMIGFIRMNLELEGHQVIEARDGLQALEAIRTKLPDLVLLDVMMPDLDGFETLRMLREFSNIPVIMLTAKGEENDKVYGLELVVRCSICAARWWASTRKFSANARRTPA